VATVPFDKETQALIGRAKSAVAEDYKTGTGFYGKKPEPTEFQKRAAMRADRIFTSMGKLDPKTGESNRNMDGPNGEQYRKAFFDSTYRYPYHNDLGKLGNALALARTEKAKNAVQFKAEADAFQKAWDERLAASTAAHKQEADK
jgi:hypothetical protein